MSLTQEQIDKYLSNPNLCPICNSKNISSIGHMQSDGKDAWVPVQCSTCGAEWQDQYVLKNVELTEDRKDTRTPSWQIEG